MVFFCTEALVLTDYDILISIMFIATKLRYFVCGCTKMCRFRCRQLKHLHLCYDLLSAYGANILFRSMPLLNVNSSQSMKLEITATQCVLRLNIVLMATNAQ